MIAAEEAKITTTQNKSAKRYEANMIAEQKLTQYSKMPWTNERHSLLLIQREIFQQHFLAARDSSYPQGCHEKMLPLEPSTVVTVRG